MRVLVTNDEATIARVLTGDCRDVMATLEPESIDAIVTDPPYGLEFMGKGWDRGVPGEEFWTAALRVAKPGAHLVAFGGTRTYHRLTCSIEDAGWEIRDGLLWLYGSGFPKSLNLGDGRGTGLKPGWEPIVLARKPLIGTVTENVARYGTGALNIDACRIDFASAEDERETKEKNRHEDFGSGARENRVYGADDRARSESGNYDAPGRWPANVVLDEDAAALLDAQSGVSTSRAGEPRASAEPGAGWGMTSTGAEYNDTGGASRFFYCAKASRAERNAGPTKNIHPTVKPLDLMRWLVRLVTPPDGLVLDPFTGSGSTGCASLPERCRFLGIELENEYAEIARHRLARAMRIPIELDLFGGAA
jgi:DNA modification methylase